jgi:hypothetical protein
MPQTDFEDEALSGVFDQTFYGHSKRSYHILYSRIEYDLMDVWKHIQDHDIANNPSDPPLPTLTHKISPPDPTRSW